MWPGTGGGARPPRFPFGTSAGKCPTRPGVCFGCWDVCHRRNILNLCLSSGAVLLCLLFSLPAWRKLRPGGGGGSDGDVLVLEGKWLHF